MPNSSWNTIWCRNLNNLCIRGNIRKMISFLHSKKKKKKKKKNIWEEILITTDKFFFSVNFFLVMNKDLHSRQECSNKIQLTFPFVVISKALLITFPEGELSIFSTTRISRLGIITDTWSRIYIEKKKKKKKQNNQLLASADSSNNGSKLWRLKKKNKIK